jgi:hypothetical protein
MQKLRISSGLIRPISRWNQTWENMLVREGRRRIRLSAGDLFYCLNHANENRASVIRSYALFSPRSYRHNTSPPPGNIAKSEYALGPACNTFACGHVLQSSALNRTVIFSRFKLAGFEKTNVDPPTPTSAAWQIGSTSASSKLTCENVTPPSALRAIARALLLLPR